MASKTEIAWADSTFNPWIGCTKVGPGCDHCYAERDWDLRRHRVQWGAGQPRSRTSAESWQNPVRWNALHYFQCKACGHRQALTGKRGVGSFMACAACGGEEFDPTRRRVFCASLADVFDNDVDQTWRADLFALIEATPNLDWLLLTKRVGNVWGMVPASWLGPVQHGPDPTNLHGGWPSHVRIGATICTQDEADRDIAKLLALGCPNFLSIEPMLGHVDLTRLRSGGWDVDALRGEWSRFHDGGIDEQSGEECVPGGPHVDWVIAGGESGPQARLSHPDWFRSLRDQCAAAGVPFLFKQWGEWAPMNQLLDRPSTTEERAHQFFNKLFKIGKKDAGRLLDGVEHNGFPRAA